MKRLALVVVALALLTGCKVDATVTLDVHDDGSGVVTLAVRLDPEAVRAAESGGAKLENRVRLADLGNAGWEIGKWVRTPDGAARIELSKKFTSPEQVTSIVAEISGANGPIRDVRAVRDRGILNTRYEVNGAVDLAAIQTGVAADADLVAALTNQQVDVNALDQSLLQQIRDALSVEVVVELPDDSTTTIEGAAGSRRAIEAESSVLDTRRVFLVLLAVALLVLAVIVFFGGRHQRRRARARAPIPRFDPHGRRS